MSVLSLFSAPSAREPLAASRAVFRLTLRNFQLALSYEYFFWRIRRSGPRVARRFLTALVNAELTAQRERLDDINPERFAEPRRADARVDARETLAGGYAQWHAASDAAARSGPGVEAMKRRE